jgi:hypothetical protein
MSRPLVCVFLFFRAAVDDPTGPSFRMASVDVCCKIWFASLRSEISRQLSYAGAAKMLGGGQSKAFSALDEVVGGLLLGGSIIGVPDILGWFDAKGKFVRLIREAVASLAG